MALEAAAGHMGGSGLMIPKRTNAFSTRDVDSTDSILLIRRKRV